MEPDILMTVYDEEVDFKCKFLTFGCSGVGKTSIILRFTENTFSSSFITTIGLDFRKKRVKQNGKLIEAQIWDTAGNERLFEITNSMCWSADGLILVYDITSEESFSMIDFWLKKVTEKMDTKNKMLILIGNKCDEIKKRQVEKEKGLKMAENKDMFFFETSAKNGTNIEEAFLSIINAVVDVKKENLLDQAAANSKIDLNERNSKSNRSSRFSFC